MSYIIEAKVGKHTYIYECTAFRKDGKAKSKRTVIGKIDPGTGAKSYKPDYIEKMRREGTPVEIASTEKVFSVDDVKQSKLREYGLSYLLQSISERSGLLGSLSEALPAFWKEVFMLACHLVATGDPFMHCEEWIKETESLPVGSMSSQRISDLTAAITPEMRDGFYRAWCSRRAEEEYLALDITSASSYSELIDDVEWGYNRDGEDLPQINICMLMGETSRLPIYQAVFAGSIKDVSTLESTLSTFDAVTGGRSVLAGMDKGFYSKRNVDNMLSGDSEKRFIVSVPFTSGFAKKQVESERKDIDRIRNAVVVCGESMRAVTKERAWSHGRNVFAHIYYAPGKAFRRKEDIYAHVAALREEAEAEPEKHAADDEHRKYLAIRKSRGAGTGFTVNVREDVAENAVGTAGWLVIISNDVSDAKQALRIYRAKDVVEKGFLRLKCDADVGRLRVHSQERMQNKVFIGFVALVMLSGIHSVMSDHKLYDKMTMKQLTRTLSKQRVHYIDNERIVYPATKAQRDIYKAFGVSEPV